MLSPKNKDKPALCIPYCQWVTLPFMLSVPPPPLETEAPYIIDFLCALPLLTQPYILLHLSSFSDSFDQRAFDEEAVDCASVWYGPFILPSQYCLHFIRPPAPVGYPYLHDAVYDVLIKLCCLIMRLSADFFKPLFSLSPVATKPFVTGFSAYFINPARFAHAYLFSGDQSDQFLIHLLFTFGVPWYGFIMPYFGQKCYRCLGTSVTYVLILFCNLRLGTVPFAIMELL